MSTKFFCDFCDDMITDKYFVLSVGKDNSVSRVLFDVHPGCLAGAVDANMKKTRNDPGGDWFNAESAHTKR